LFSNPASVFRRIPRAPGTGFARRSKAQAAHFARLGLDFEDS
jgi:hypothetical protein